MDRGTSRYIISLRALFCFLSASKSKKMKASEEMRAAIVFSFLSSLNPGSAEACLGFLLFLQSAAHLQDRCACWEEGRHGCCVTTKP